MTARTALLFLNTSPSKINSRITAALKVAVANVEESLYVHMYSTQSSGCPDLISRPTVRRLLSCSSQFYAAASSLVPSLDVTVLHRYHQEAPHILRNAIELLLVDTAESSHLVEASKSVYKTVNDVKVLEYSPQTTETTDEDVTKGFLDETYDYCALGGTFDSIHNGHKVLLGAAIAMSNKSLVIGVTDESMNKKKSLKELIAPVDVRKAAVSQYVESVRPDLLYDIVTLHDPFGPTITDEKLQCIIVSEETKGGAESINRRRREKGFAEMVQHCISLVANEDRAEHQEEKISSSSIREQRLGTLLRPVEARPNLARRPYLIGLTGGIASGKSSVGQRLERLGAGLVNSDLLAHEVYRRGSDAYNQVVEAFGKQILNPKTGEIERRKLGDIVFGDKSELDRLNGIVWPATAKLVQEKVEELYQQGREVCFIEAALLLEAGWQERLHEVWCCMVPEQEAVRRLGERNGLSEQQSLQRIHSQADNQFRVDRSNVVLSTLWDYSVTQQQVEKAWRLLQERLA